VSTVGSHRLATGKIFNPRMQTKKPRHEPITVASLSPSSIYHLRAACVRVIENETSSLKDGMGLVAEKVYHH
jgi:hypothetical protein